MRKATLASGVFAFASFIGGMALADDLWVSTSAFPDRYTQGFNFPVCVDDAGNYRPGFQTQSAGFQYLEFSTAQFGEFAGQIFRPLSGHGEIFYSMSGDQVNAVLYRNEGGDWERVPSRNISVEPKRTPCP